MIIRSGVRHDAAPLARIHREAREAAMPWLPVLHTPEEDFEFFRNHVLAKQTVWVTAEVGSVLGFIAFKGVEIDHLYVDPKHWRRGIGADLLQRLQAESTRLSLWTFQNNGGARAFYRRFGFQEVEFTDGAHNEEQTPDVKLVWEK